MTDMNTPLVPRIPAQYVGPYVCATASRLPYTRLSWTLFQLPSTSQLYVGEKQGTDGDGAQRHQVVPQIPRRTVRYRLTVEELRPGRSVQKQTNTIVINPLMHKVAKMVACS